MSIPKGLRFDGELAVRRAFAVCGKCALRVNLYEVCAGCIVANKYRRVSCMSPFDFELVHPPKIYLEMFPNVQGYPTPNRPTSTAEIIMVYTAAIDVFSQLFDPDYSYYENGTDGLNWKKTHEDTRAEAKEIWRPCREEMSEEITKIDKDAGQTKTMLDFVRVLETAIMRGQAIAAFCSGKLVGKDWKVEAEALVDEKASIRLIPWTLERCRSDKLAVAEEINEKWNFDRRNFESALAEIERLQREGREEGEIEEPEDGAMEVD